MFSMKQKQHIASELEKILLELKHPEMPTSKPMFFLRVEGAQDWSWAEIEPNWTFEHRTPGINPHNELMDRGQANDHPNPYLN